MASDIPLEQVLQMRNQGLTNDQIIQNLQRYGYPLNLINNAINQADIKEGITTTQYQMGMDSPPPLSAVPMQQAQPQRQQRPGQASPPAFGSGHDTEVGVEEEERIHEVAEAIIEEKWSSLIENVSKILEWKDTAESRLTKMEQSIEDLRHNFDKLHEGVLGRLGEYDTTMKDIGTELKALEKVFQKILPGFVDNVQELSRITERMRGTGTKKQ
ncbi:hypothetical protein HYS47_04115 [Candidatus Woesearchaeota archaeon]|nr:hypothetical protein [Candidatus Woesearchaeota archaeon]